MTSNEKEFRRHFPVVNKCFCCCCMNLKTAVRACTIFLIIMYGISLFFGDIISIIFNAVTIISMLFLLIGIAKKNITFMKQFIYVYIARIFISVVKIIILILIFIIFKEFFILFVYSYFFGGNNALNEDNAKEVCIYVVIGFLLFYVVFECIEIYYYIAVGSYIEQTIEDIQNSEKNRNLENNN